MKKENPTVSLLVIGNEILYGERRDSHSFWLAQKLPRYGLTLKQILVLPDVMKTLIHSIREEVQSSTYVFTMGGIGATPDDLTRQAVAKALQRKLTKHSQAAALLADHYGGRLNNHRLQLAYLPYGSELLFHPSRSYYGFRCQNVFSFPGFPELARPMLRVLLPGLMPSSHGKIKQVKRSFRVDREESALISHLIGLERKFPSLLVGSYPEMPKQGVYRVVLRLRGESKAVNRAAQWLTEALDRDRISFFEVTEEGAKKGLGKLPSPCET